MFTKHNMHVCIGRMTLENRSDWEDTISEGPVRQREEQTTESPAKRPRGRPKKNTETTTGTTTGTTMTVSMEPPARSESSSETIDIEDLLMDMDLDLSTLSSNKDMVARTLLNGLNRGTFTADSLIKYFLGGSQPVYHNMIMADYDRCMAKFPYTLVLSEDYKIPENVKCFLQLEKRGILSVCCEEGLKTLGDGSFMYALYSRVEVKSNDLNASDGLLPVGIIFGVPKLFHDFDSSVYLFDFNYTKSYTGDKVVIDTEKSSNIFRFMNHSSVPNIKVESHVYCGIEYIIAFAIAPISVGDELTFNYGTDGPVSAN